MLMELKVANSDSKATLPSATVIESLNLWKRMGSAIK
jgi:hypothetical protein